jgi:hypothetical protein
MGQDCGYVSQASTPEHSPTRDDLLAAGSCGGRLGIQMLYCTLIPNPFRGFSEGGFGA